MFEDRQNKIQLNEIKFISKKELLKNQQKDFVPPTKQQIVSSEASDETTAPEKSRFLSDHNRKFLRETVAKRNGSFQEMGKGTSLGEKLAETNEITALSKTQSKKLSLQDLAIGLKNHSPSEIENQIPTKSGMLNGLSKQKTIQQKIKQATVS